MPWEGTTPSNFSPMASITEVSDWLSSLKLLRLNMWTRIHPTVQVWSTYIRVDAYSLWSRGQYKYTSIIQRSEIRYGKLTFFICLFYRLFQQQEQIQKEWVKIWPQKHHKSHWLYKFQSISLRGHFKVLLASPIPRLEFWWTIDMTAKSRFFIGNLQILRSGAS